MKQFIILVLYLARSCAAKVTVTTEKSVIKNVGDNIEVGCTVTFDDTSKYTTKTCSWKIQSILELSVDCNDIHYKRMGFMASYAGEQCCQVEYGTDQDVHQKSSCVNIIPRVKGIDEDLFRCTFGPNEQGSICDFIQDDSDKFDWSLWCDNTPTQDTGPENGYGGSGYYIFIETSDPNLPGNNARIYTPDLNYVGASCVRFAYHMLGDHIGKLIMYVQFGDKDNRINKWNREGQQGTVWQASNYDYRTNWLTAAVDVHLPDIKSSIGFDAFKGVESPRGDIAIDEVSISRGTCQSTSTASNTASTSTTTKRPTTTTKRPTRRSTSSTWPTPTYPTYPTFSTTTTAKNKCIYNPCYHGGVCNPDGNSYTCDCTGTGFEGSRCQNNINDCVIYPCFNGGFCSDGVNSRTCICSAGFAGEDCSKELPGSDSDSQPSTDKDTLSKTSTIIIGCGVSFVLIGSGLIVVVLVMTKRRKEKEVPAKTSKEALVINKKSSKGDKVYVYSRNFH